MNSQPGRGVQQQAKPPLSEAAKASRTKTFALFRMFLVSVLGALFVYQLDVNYLWLSTVLTVAGMALGIFLLVRAIRLRESKLVLVGTISGLVMAVVMVPLLLTAMVFFNQVRDYQGCVGRALTDRAANACVTQFQDLLPTKVG